MNKVYLGNEEFELTFTSGRVVQLSISDIKELIESDIIKPTVSTTSSLTLVDPLDPEVIKYTFDN